MGKKVDKEVESETLMRQLITRELDDKLEELEEKMDKEERAILVENTLELIEGPVGLLIETLVERELEDCGLVGDDPEGEEVEGEGEGEDGELEDAA